MFWRNIFVGYGEGNWAKIETDLNMEMVGMGETIEIFALLLKLPVLGFPDGMIVSMLMLRDIYM